jgi:hypothetical protein
MGYPYIFSIYAYWQLGLLIKFEYKSVILTVLFLNIHINWSEFSSGVEFFNWYSSN